MGQGAKTAEESMRFFAHELPLKLEVEAIVAVMAELPLKDPTCLSIGLEDCAMGQFLEAGEGVWTHQAFEKIAEGSFSSKLEQDSESFELLVIGHAVMSLVPDDVQFLRECHRLLKPGGHLILVTEHPKQGIARSYRQRLRLGPQQLGWARDGYREEDLARGFKSGYDVLTVKSFVRLNVELVRIKRESLTKPTDTKANKKATLFYTLAQAVDSLLFWTAGHRMLVHGRKRIWQERPSPTLKDGRSIPEAVLSRAP